MSEQLREDGKCIHGMVPGTCAHCLDQIPPKSFRYSPRSNHTFVFFSMTIFSSFHINKMSCDPIENESEFFV